MSAEFLCALAATLFPYKGSENESDFEVCTPVEDFKVGDKLLCGCLLHINMHYMEYSYVYQLIIFINYMQPFPGGESMVLITTTEKQGSNCEYCLIKMKGVVCYSNELFVYIDNIVFLWYHN